LPLRATGLLGGTIVLLVLGVTVEDEDSVLSPDDWPPQAYKKANTKNKVEITRIACNILDPSWLYAVTALNILFILLWPMNRLEPHIDYQICDAFL